MKKDQNTLDPEIAALSLNTLKLSIRLLNTLKRAKIETIGQLARCSEQDLLNLNYVGPKSLQKLRNSLSDIGIEGLLSSSVQPQQPSPPAPLPIMGEGRETPREPKQPLFPVAQIADFPIERIEQILAQLPEREAQVLRWRYGLDGNEPLTLEQVGAILGISSERVRQLQKRATSKLPSSHYRRMMKPLIDLLEKALEKECGLLSVDVAENVLSAEDLKVPISSELLLEFILLFTGRRIERLKKGPFIILNRPPYDEYHHHLLKIQSIFEKILKKTHAPLPEDQILARFVTKKKAQAIASEVSTDYLKACLDAYPEIEINQDGEYSLKRWHKSVTDDMIVVLRKHGKPLHYSEIAKRINERVSKKQKTTASNIHAKLGYYRDIFIRVGHGIFGLAEWDLKQDRTLADAAVRVLHEVGHVLTISELTDKVLETWHVKPRSVQAAVHLEPRIVRVGYNLYRLADSVQNQKQAIEDD